MNIPMVSTRDASRAGHTYTDVLLSGLAPDGGLYVPAAYPKFSTEELAELKTMSYLDVVFLVKNKLIGDSIDEKMLRELIVAAYPNEAFEVEHAQYAPVTQIEDGLWVENLSLGPTASFKDMAMQLLGREMQFELERKKESLVILGATSGDTGSAAEAAFKGLSNIKVFMLSPEVGMSGFQKAQMGGLSGGNIFNISIRGRFDDCQDLVKAVKKDPEFSKLGAVNSINWARISSQIPYYFSGYLQVAKDIGEPVDFAVPSGNFGNVLSGYIAKQMGLPIRKLIVATNENNVLDRLFKTGIYEMSPAQITSSPSMDISKASNYERLAYDVLDRDPVKTAAYMNEFERNGKVSLSDYGKDRYVFSSMGFVSGSSTHADRIATIKSVYEKSKLVIDPHTADGVFTGTKHKEDGIPMVCMSTALPVKFEDTVREALGFVPPRPPRFVDIKDPQKNAFTVMDADASALKEFIRANS
jgi:threonine synthase